MKMRLGLVAAALAALVGGQSARAAIAIGTSGAAFVDISATGTAVPGALSDDSEHTVTGAALGFVGNGLLAGGMSIRVGNNGGIIWGNSATDVFTGATDVGYYNAGPLNSGTTPPALSIATMGAANGSANGNGGGLRQFLAPLWDDYVPNSAGTTSIKYQIVGSDLVVQWQLEDAFAASGSGFVTFESIIHGGVTIASGQSLVDFVYQDTSFLPLQYQNDGGSATIGYKNWALNANANDVEFGIGGGGTSSTSDPAFGGAGMQPKVAGYVANDNPLLPHAICIAGGVGPLTCAVPEPTTLGLLGIGALALVRRRR